MTIHEPRRGHPAGGRDRLLLVHGVAATRRVWDPVASGPRRLLRRAGPNPTRALRRAPFPPGVAPRTEALADWLARELDAAGWDTAQDVGHVPMPDDPRGTANLIRDFAMRLTGGQLSAPPDRRACGGESELRRRPLDSDARTLAT